MAPDSDRGESLWGGAMRVHLGYGTSTRSPDEAKRNPGLAVFAMPPDSDRRKSPWDGAMRLHSGYGSGFARSVLR
jgi:hypothetical protein